MTTGDLLCAIGEVDERFVEEAGEADAEAPEGACVGRSGIFLRIVAAALFLGVIGTAYLYADGEKAIRRNRDKQEAGQMAVDFGTEECAEIIAESDMEKAIESDAEYGAEGAVERIAESGVERAVESNASFGVEESAEGATGSGTERGVENNGIFRPTSEEEQQDQHTETVMISSFGESDDEVAAADRTAAKIKDDMAVINGGVFLSHSLSGALDYYGDKEEYRYRVFVELFQDGQQIANDGDPAQKEAQRLSHMGYTVAIETCSDGEVTQTYFTLHATADQLRNFTPDPAFGYALWLYDECVEGVSDSEGTVHVWYGNSNAGMEGSAEGH